MKTRQQLWAIFTAATYLSFTLDACAPRSSGGSESSVAPSLNEKTAAVVQTPSLDTGGGPVGGAPDGGASDAGPPTADSMTILATETVTSSDGGTYAMVRTRGVADVTADGAATYHIPLWVPPGRAGVQPNLSQAA